MANPFKRLGKAVIKVNGQVLESMPGATLNVGGTTRGERVTHDKVHFSESLAHGELSMEVLYAATTDLAALGKMDDVTMTFECDTGQSFIGNHWWLAQPPELSDGPDSRVSLVFRGNPAEEVKAAGTI
ncbi:MAG: phage tail tube protein [Rhodospirillales bacterium]